MSRLLPLALLLACSATPLAAAPAQPNTAAQPKEDFGKWVSAFIDKLSAHDDKGAEQDLDKWALTVPDTQGAKALVLNFRAMIAGTRGRDGEATALLAKSEDLLADQAELAPMTYIGLLVTGRPKLFTAYLDHMIGRYPDKVRELDFTMVRPAVADDTGEAARAVDDRRIALAQLGFGGDEGDYFTAAAVRLLLARGDQAGAASLVRDIDEPNVLEDLLIQRRFAPLWPALASQAGPHLATSTATMVRKAEQKYEADKTNHEARSNLINAYRKAGRYDALPVLRATLPTSPAELATADEQTGWAINNLAYAAFEQGRADEADALFAGLNNAVTESWRISMLINRIEMLVSAEHFDRVLPLVDEAEKVNQSPYATQLLRRLRYCSLVRLGRAAEAAPLRPALMAHAKDALGPTVDGLLCAGEVDAAEQLALTIPDKPEDQADFVRSLQPLPLTSDDPSSRRRWDPLRDRPAIRALYDRLGRDLPEDLAPAPAKS